MDLQNLFPGLAYKDEEPAPQDSMMNLGLKEIVEMALSKDQNVLKEAAAEAEKHRKETEKKAQERESNTNRGFNEQKRDFKLNELDQQEARVLATGTQLLYDLSVDNVERRDGSQDPSHAEYPNKHFPGAKKLLFFTDKKGIVRAAWNQQLTMEEGNELERQEIAELAKSATSEEDKAYYSNLLDILQKEKEGGRTPADEKYDASWLGQWMHGGYRRLFQSDAEKAYDEITTNKTKEALQNNIELAPTLRAAIEQKYGRLIEEENRNRKEQAEIAEKRKAAEAAHKKTTKKK